MDCVKCKYREMMKSQRETCFKIHQICLEMQSRAPKVTINKPTCYNYLVIYFNLVGFPRSTFSIYIDLNRFYLQLQASFTRNYELLIEVFFVRSEHQSVSDCLVLASWKTNIEDPGICECRSVTASDSGGAAGIFEHISHSQTCQE